MADPKNRTGRLVAMFCLLSIFFLMEIIIGYAMDSLSMISDSFHMLTDMISMCVAYLAIRMSPKKWKRSTYGWARAEVLGALVNSVTLVGLCFSIVVESIERFLSPKSMSDPATVFYVGIVGLVVNLIGLFLFQDHGHSHGTPDPSPPEQVGSVRPMITTSEEKALRSVEHKMGDLNLRGVYLHILTDTLGSVIVILSAYVVWKTDWKYKYFVDPGLSLFMALLIIKTSLPLITGSVSVLLQTVPAHINIEAITLNLAKSVPEVLDIQQVCVWQLVGDRIILSAQILFANFNTYTITAMKVKEYFHDAGIHATTIQPIFLYTPSSKS